MDHDDWNDRFSGSDYVFGTEPAAFLTRAAPVLPPGARVLCPADGEGRNSAWLAGQGLKVTAFDVAPAAVEKAWKLDDRLGVTVERNISTLEEWDWSQSFDAVVGIFFQFLGPEARSEAFDWMAEATRPGGHLLIHGYAPRQVGYGTGGPGVPENMYTAEILRDAFPGWEILTLNDYDADIKEGEGHAGRSALVDFVARKPV